MELDIFKPVEQLTYAELRKAYQLHRNRAVEIHEHLRKHEQEMDEQVEKYLHEIKEA
jgi:hypothetical protein